MKQMCCGEPFWMMEIRGVYDGALYFFCKRCDRKVHRFPPDHWLGQKARQWAAANDVVIEEPVD